MRLLIIIFFQISIAAEAHASSLFDLTTSVRALGMGGAYTAIVNNSDALFYNPASLSKVSGVYWTIGDPKFGVSNLETLTTLTDLQSDTGIAGALNDLYGEPIWIGGGGKTAVTLPYFGVMFYDNLNAQISLTNPIYPEMQVDYANDVGIGVGFAFPIIPGVLYSGIGIKRIDRTGGSKTVSGDVLGNLDSDALLDGFEDNGLGYSLDVGLNLTIPTPVLTPTISFVWKNLGQTSFTKVKNDAPVGDEENMILAGALEVDIPLFTITGSIELRNLNDSDMQLANKLYMGAEFSMPFIDVRAGFHQGYYTLGAGLGLGPMQIDAATYGVELGAYPGQIEDRRYMLSLTFELGIGGLGGLLGGGGGSGGDSGGVGSKRRSRLKQRR